MRGHRRPPYRASSAQAFPSSRAFGDGPITELLERPRMPRPLGASSPSSSRLGCLGVRSLGDLSGCALSPRISPSDRGARSIPNGGDSRRLLAARTSPPGCRRSPRFSPPNRRFGLSRCSPFPSSDPCGRRPSETARYPSSERPPSRRPSARSRCSLLRDSYHAVPTAHSMLPCIVPQAFPGALCPVSDRAGLRRDLGDRRYAA